MVTSDLVSGQNKSSSGQQNNHFQNQNNQIENAPYERVIFNGAVYRDEHAREMLFGGARAQLVQQQHDQSNAVAIANKAPSANLMRAAQLPNQRRQTAIGIQATSSSSGSENDSASYSQSQLASKSGSGYHQSSRPPPPPPLALQSLQQPNSLSSNISANHTSLVNAVETPVNNVPRPTPQSDHRISAVLHAISNGRVSMLRSVWSHDLPLYVDEHKNTVLHWCAKYEGAAKCLKWLIKNTNVPLSARNFRGELCTHVAARHGILSCLKVALMSSTNGNNVVSSESAGGSGGHNGGSGSGTDRLFSATEKDKRGFTILHLAVIKQRFPIVRWLTKQTFSALLVRIADNNNNLPLHYAALRGSKKMAQFLLKKNKDMLNLRNVSGATPLHVAAFEGRSIVFVQWLVEEVGADATAVMESGVNLLHVSAAGGSIAVVRYLLSTTRQPAEAVLSRSQDGSTIFHFSAANGHAHLLQWLWSQRGNSSSRTGSAGSLPSSLSSNKSPLSTALAAGIHLRNTLGNSPAHAAAEAGQAATFRQLVEFGADIFGKNKAGLSALEVALSNKNPALVRLADDIRRLLLDPTFATSSEATTVPGHNHISTMPARSSSNQSSNQSQQGVRAGQPVSNNNGANNNGLASTIAGYHSNLTASFNALHLPETSPVQRNQITGENRLQMQLHIATGELGTLDGDNENDDEIVDGGRTAAINNEDGGEEVFVVKRVNENVFLKHGDVQQQIGHRTSNKAPSQSSYAFSNWREKIFSQKGRRQQSTQMATANSNNNVIVNANNNNNNNNNGIITNHQLNNVPELAQLMTQDQQMMRNQSSQLYRSNTNHNGNEIVGEEGDYWDRLSTDIRRLLVLRRYP